MYEIHALARYLPPMEDQQYRDLKESIRVSGLQKDIVLFEGQVLMGAHREKACEELGVTPTYREFAGTMEEAVEAVKIEEIYRRHATVSQRAMALESLRRHGADVSASGVSSRTMDFAKTVLKNGSPELCNAVREDIVSASDAVKAAKLPKKKQDRLVKQVRSGKHKTIGAALKSDSWEGPDDNGEEDSPDVDQFGTLVPPPLRDVFKSTILADAVVAIRDALNSIAGCSSWHPWMLYGSLRSDLERVASSVQENLPVSICQKCHGTGCRECRSAGWLPRWRVDEIGYTR